MTALEPYWNDEDVTLHLGDCLDVLRTLEADSIDAIVTDPPAGIAFMDREWDDFRRARNPADAGRDSVFGRTSAHGPEYGRRDRGQFVDMLTARMAEAYRVLKPGGHALVWAIPRTSHWTAWAIEDAGFDIRDCVMHLFGSGFPKSRNVSKDIDAMAGVEREVISEGRPVKRMIPGADQNRTGSWIKDNGREFVPTVTAPATQDAARWAGWGTALKPGQEMWWLARKPLASTVAANVLQFGTGALNVDGCRVATTDSLSGGAATKGSASHTDGWDRPWKNDPVATAAHAARVAENVEHAEALGRWPANIVLTHSAACEPAGMRAVRSDGHHPAVRGPGGLGTSGHAGQDGLTERKSGTEDIEAWSCVPDCPVGELDRQSGVRTSGSRKAGTYGLMGYMGAEATAMPAIDGDAGGASRFYPTFRYQAKAPASERPHLEDGSAHETVKPLGLITWLVKLITPPGGMVLDLFAGSGPVAEACIIEGFRCILIEQDPKSAELIKTRLSKPIQPAMLTVDDSAPPAPARPVAASRPKPPPEAHPSLFDLEDAS